MIPQADPSFLGKALLRAVRSSTAPRYSDVTIITDDGERVYAFANILALTSGFFKDILIPSPGQEKLTVHLNVKYKELSMALEFSLTDDCALLRTIEQRCGIKRCDEIKQLLQLVKAAEYLEMPRLFGRCTSAFRRALRIRPSLACAAANSLHSLVADNAWARDMWKEAVSFAATSCYTAFFGRHDEDCERTSGVLHLGFESVELFFTELLQENATDNYIAFQALIIWASAGEALCNGKRRQSDDVFVSMTDIAYGREEETLAKRITQHFPLGSFEPRFLSKVVEPSRLLEKSLFPAAYKTIALAQQKEIRGFKTRNRELDSEDSDNSTSQSY